MMAIANLDYASLKSLAGTNRRNKALVIQVLSEKALMARSILGPATDGLTDWELMEHIYHLNNYRSSDIDGISIENDMRFGVMWTKLLFAGKGWSKPTASIQHHKGVERWYIGQVQHRLDGPAEIFYDPDGQVTSFEWKWNNRPHRFNGPAKYVVGQLEQWSVYDTLHRIDGPAVKSKDGLSWAMYGHLHRIDGPAVQPDIGHSKWFFYGVELPADTVRVLGALLNELTAIIQITPLTEDTTESEFTEIRTLWDTVAHLALQANYQKREKHIPSSLNRILKLGQAELTLVEECIKRAAAELGNA